MDRLTPRQVEVLTTVCETGSLAGAAARLGLSQSTVKNHLWVAYDRLGVRGAAEACYRLGQAMGRAAAADDLAAGEERWAAGWPAGAEAAGDDAQRIG